MKKKNILGILGKSFRWFIAVSLLIYILSQISFEIILGLFHTLNWVALLLSLVMKFGIRFCAALKWYVLLRIHHSALSFSKVLVVSFVGGAVGQMLSVIGADFTMGYAYYRQSGRAGSSISSLLVDRIIGVHIIILTAVVGVILGWQRFSSIQPILFLVFGSSLSAITGTLLLIYLLRHQSLISILPLPASWKELIDEIRNLITGYFNTGISVLAMNIGISFVTQLLRIFCVYAVAVGVTSHVSLVDFVVITPIIFLITLIPVSVNAFGVQEGAFIFLLGMVGISAETAFTISILSRALTLISVLPGPVYIILDRFWRKESEEMDVSKIS